MNRCRRTARSPGSAMPAPTPPTTGIARNVSPVTTAEPPSANARPRTGAGSSPDPLPPPPRADPARPATPGGQEAPPRLGFLARPRHPLAQRGGRPGGDPPDPRQAVNPAGVPPPHVGRRIPADRVPEPATDVFDEEQ